MHKIYVMDIVQKNGVVPTRIGPDSGALYKADIIDIRPDKL